MKNLKAKSGSGGAIGAIVALIVIVAVVIYFSQNNPLNQSYVPSVSFTLSQSSVSVRSGQASGIIIATVTKQDSQNTPTNFTISLKPAVPEITLAFVSTCSGTHGYNCTTKTLSAHGSYDEAEFEVMGTPPANTTIIANVSVNLYWEGKLLGHKILSVTLNS